MVSKIKNISTCSCMHGNVFFSLVHYFKQKPMFMYIHNYTCTHSISGTILKKSNCSTCICTCTMNQLRGNLSTLAIGYSYTVR